MPTMLEICSPPPHSSSPISAQSLSLAPPPPPSTPEPLAITRPHTPSEPRISGDWQAIAIPDSGAPKTQCSKISLSIQSKIRYLCTIAFWPFCSIAQEFKLPVSMVFSICAQPNTPQATHTGQPHILSQAQQENLINYATASQTNHCKSFSTIAEEIGIHAHERTSGKK